MMVFNKFCMTVGLSFFSLVGFAQASELTLYSGRGEALVAPLIKKFEEQTKIKVNTRYGDTAALAVLLQEEGKNSTTDVYWAQDAGALASLAKAGLLSELPESATKDLPDVYKSKSNLWVATSGRARVLAYSPERAKKEDHPQSVLDFTDVKYKNRLGWAPTNGSFQAFITGMRLTKGEEATKKWLVSVKENGTQVFSNNVALLQAIADGKIDYALVNNYYLPRAKARDKSFPVEQTHFKDKDIGNMMNVAGVAIPAANADKTDALKFIEFLHSTDAQTYAANEAFEYSVLKDKEKEAVARSPEVVPDNLNDLEGTLGVLREVGLL